MLAQLQQHWFWLTLTVAAVVWYSTITIYIAVQGAFDIRHMLDSLKQKQDRPPGPAVRSRLARVPPAGRG